MGEGEQKEGTLSDCPTGLGCCVPISGDVVNSTSLTGGSGDSFRKRRTVAVADTADDNFWRVFCICCSSICSCRFIASNCIARSMALFTRVLIAFIAAIFTEGLSDCRAISIRVSNCSSIVYPCSRSIFSTAVTRVKSPTRFTRSNCPVRPSRFRRARLSLPIPLYIRPVVQNVHRGSRCILGIVAIGESALWGNHRYRVLGAMGESALWGLRWVR